MLPKDHEEVTGFVWGSPHVAVIDETATHFVEFLNSKSARTPEWVLERIDSYPKNVILRNGMSQNITFLDLIATELVNRDHIVTISGSGSYKIPPRLTGANIHFDLDGEYGVYRDNYRWLTKHDRITFPIEDENSYDRFKVHVKDIKAAVATPVRFRVVPGMGYAYAYLIDNILRDKLEVEIGYGS